MITKYCEINVYKYISYTKNPPKQNRNIHSYNSKGVLIVLITKAIPLVLVFRRFFMSSTGSVR